MARLRPLTHADRAPDTMHVASMSAGPTDPVAAKDYLGAPEYHPAFARYLQECLDDEQAVSWPTSDRWWASPYVVARLTQHADPHAVEAVVTMRRLLDPYAEDIRAQEDDQEDPEDEDGVPQAVRRFLGPAVIAGASPLAEGALLAAAFARIAATYGHGMEWLLYQDRKLFTLARRRYFPSHAAGRSARYARSAHQEHLQGGGTPTDTPLAS